MRTFHDPNGTEWQVWKVVPVSPLVLERRRTDRRQDHETEPPVPPGERRTRGDRRSPESGSLKDGWLCFQAGDQKRRLSPVPADWETCPEQALSEMHRAASTVHSRARTGQS